MVQTARICLLFCLLLHHAAAQKSLIGVTPQYEDLTNGDHDYIFPLNPYEFDDLEPHIGQYVILAHHWGITDEYRRLVNKDLEEFKTEVSID